MSSALGVELSLRAGEVHVLLGENGSGNSRSSDPSCPPHDAARFACTRESPNHARATPWRADPRIYQELNLVPHLSVAENIFLGAAPTQWGGVIDWRQLEQRAATLLSELGMEIDPSRPLHSLSLAHRQMVEIAKALATQASVLVMDEPTSALTSREVDQLFALVERLIARGVAIVYITHRLDEVYRIGIA